MDKFNIEDQANIISTFTKFFLVQSQIEYNFQLEDVATAHINNNALYVGFFSNRATEVIQLYGKI